MLRALLLLGGLAPSLPAGPHWAYEGPHGQQHWPEGHPACGGRAQSPIDIRTQRAQPDPSLPPLRPVGYHRPGTPTFTLANNGHTAVLGLPPSLRLQGLPRSFAAAQLHFHWGRSGRTGGAEHLLDGHRAPAEMHVVHYDAERYANASEAQHHTGGLAVLGVLLEVGADPHPAYDNILSHLGSIRYAGQTTAIPSFSVQDLLPRRLDLYYRYNGSLTTPPCFQGVLWTLFQQPVRISLAQGPRGIQQSLPSSSAPAPAASAFSSSFTLWPRGCERGGRRNRTSCSKPPPATPPPTTALALEPQPRLGCDRPPQTSPPPVPGELPGAQPHGSGSSCPGPTGNKAPSPPHSTGGSLLGRERDPMGLGAGSCQPQETRTPLKTGSKAKKGWGGDQPLFPPPTPITEVASVPWYPSLY
ncbi:carbonic anhydrase 14 isoform X2 [Tyto alba]|uniref:carbonic anhydrase 14 isoform X2 n=1 Tax=Tyto alba TaxID=56313 RepID=UPI001C67DA45|nr:carbonic anhydrase 14 isoform X2 [Tyto alba]